MREFSYYTLPPFEGESIEEASDYIDKWKRLAHERVGFERDGGGDGDD